MSFEKDIQKARDHLAQAEDLYRRNKRSLFMIQKMCRKAEYKLLDLEQKAKDAAEEAKYVDFPPFVCAIQYEPHHSYSSDPPKVETVYECRGKHVYVQGTTTPISTRELARHGHFGSGFRVGGYHRKSIVGMVKEHFLDYFQGKTTELPKPLEFRSSYCGN